MLIRALLVDDEPSGREALRNLLQGYCPNVDIIAEAASVQEATEAIRLKKPALVFLDINLPDGSGFDLLQQTGSDYYTVFVTAYDTYAIKAIKNAAVDYILKPIDIEDLVAAVDKVTKRAASENRALQIEKMVDTFRVSYDSGKIMLPVLNGFIYAKREDIIRCEAEGSYTAVHFCNADKMLVCRNLGSYENLLKTQGFIRVHHHHVINIIHIEKYQRGRGGIVTMSDKKEIEVSHRRREEFLRIIRGLDT